MLPQRTSTYCSVHAWEEDLERLSHCGSAEEALKSEHVANLLRSSDIPEELKTALGIAHHEARGYAAVMDLEHGLIANSVQSAIRNTLAPIFKEEVPLAESNGVAALEESLSALDQLYLRSGGGQNAALYQCEIRLCQGKLRKLVGAALDGTGSTKVRRQNGFDWRRLTSWPRSMPDLQRKIGQFYQY